MPRQKFLLATALAAAIVIAACSTPTTQPVAAPEPVAGPVPVATTVMEASQAQKSAALADMSRHRESRAIGILPPSPPVFAPPQIEQRERYAALESNPLQLASEHPVSTFSIDVDTGAYSNVRRFLQQGQLPPSDAVRVEELVNYFDYAYAPPRDRATPFSVLTEIAPTPWNAKTQLLHIGIQGWKPEGRRLPSNLVFLVDVSGSMNDADKLPLVKSSLKLLTQQLTKDDRISLVVYAGASGVVLEPTPGNQTATIVAALDRLQAGGSTNGAAGLQLAYDMARQGYIEGGVNRVLLATDGDFNVGTTSFERLLDLVKEQRKSGVALTTLGFGQGNYNEQLMEQAADAGNGNYAYIDSLSEAQKVLVRQREATLTTIASDVKIQVEINPALVSEYRLIGYENRLLRREDFANDKIDAGEIGAGHTVTALYEITLAGSGGERVEPLRYGETKAVPAKGDELAHLRLRYKLPAEGMNAASRLIEQPLYRRDIAANLDRSSDAFRLSAAVTAFGQLLRGGSYTGGMDYAAVAKLARAARGDDPYGEAGEFLKLVELADSLSAKQARVEQAEQPRVN